MEKKFKIQLEIVDCLCHIQGFEKKKKIYQFDRTTWILKSNALFFLTRPTTNIILISNIHNLTIW